MNYWHHGGVNFTFNVLDDQSYENLSFPMPWLLEHYAFADKGPIRTLYSGVQHMQGRI